MGDSKAELSADSICRILEVSAQAGVSELKFGDLHVTFGKPAETRITGSPLGYPFVPQAPTPEPVTVLTEEEHKKISKGALEVEEVRARERQLADLLITDPSKYEELLRNGDLSDDMDGTDNDEVDE